MTLQERLQAARRPGGYDPGDALELTVKDAAGDEHTSCFVIESYCGGGFAGQVYRARCTDSSLPGLSVGQPYALKFFATRSSMRRRFRDLLYWVAFQSPFPHQYNEAAVRAGLPLTRLLKIAFARAFGTDDPINDCYGTFWDDHIRSYGEVNEWVDGYVTDPVPDDGLLVRWAHNRRVRETGEGETQACELEIAKKRTFMDRVVSLCWAMGLEDLARQAYWWTGMSQANLLTRTDSKNTGDPKFVWVDRRPGLPGFILSLGDVALFFRALLRWSVPPFDKIGFRKLRAWFAENAKGDGARDLAELEELDSAYRRSQLALFGNHFRLLTDKSLREQISKARVEYWYLSGRVDAGQKERLLSSKVDFLASFALSLVPVLGRPLQKLIRNRDWRLHLKRLLLDGAYRAQHLDEQRAGALKVWLSEGRLTEARAEAVYQSFPRYVGDVASNRIVAALAVAGAVWAPHLAGLVARCANLFLEEELFGHSVHARMAIIILRLAFGALALYSLSNPPGWQLFLTDAAYRWDCLKRCFTSPVKYIFVGSYRRQVNMDWMRNRTEEDVERGFVERDAADRFIEVSGDRAMQEYLTGIMVTAAVKPTSEVCYVLFWGWVLMQVDKLKALGWWLLPVVALVAAVSPSGTLRFTYCLLRLPFRRGVPYGTATLLAGFRAFGDLAFFLQIARTYPAFSRYVLTASVCRMAEHFPVFGERGGLLSIWTVTALLSWPASFRRWREER